jgi:cytochrome c oxidase assembly protein subunit 11
MSNGRTRTALEQRNRKVGAMFACLAFGMLGMAYAAVPLYQMFCQATGFAGTTQRATKPSETVLDRTITVRFDANVIALDWEFQPVERTMQVRIGENALAFYRATNRSDRPLTGSATFNVSPDVTGGFFNKLECFCFKEQRLEPGQSLDMPVSFYVDPAIMGDKDGRKVGEITLSYTFYPIEKPKQAAEVLNTKAGPEDKGGG